MTGEARDKQVGSQLFANSKLSVLRKHPIFADLEPEAFDQLCRYAKLHLAEAGAALFAKGDPGLSLYAVISGSVKMSISSADGRSAISEHHRTRRDFRRDRVARRRGTVIRCDRKYQLRAVRH